MGFPMRWRGGGMAVAKHFSGWKWTAGTVLEEQWKQITEDACNWRIPMRLNGVYQLFSVSWDRPGWLMPFDGVFLQFPVELL